MQKRAVWKVIVFGIITLGIYDLVWLYKTRNELVAKGHKIPSFWWLFAPVALLLLVAVLQFIFRFILSGATPDAPVQEARLASQLVNIFSILAGVIALLGALPISLYWFYKYSQAVERITGGAASLGLLFGLWVVFAIVGIFFVWPGLVQDYFNKLSSDPNQGAIPDTPYPTSTHPAA